ncbi:MAG: hypothetical protein ACKVOM_12355 [Ferruginibacter sp.]
MSKIKEAIEEMKPIKAGKKQARSADDFLCKQAVSLSTTGNNYWYKLAVNNIRASRSGRLLFKIYPLYNKIFVQKYELLY